MTTNQNNLPSLDIIFDIIKESIKNQQDRIDALDAKANFIFVSSSVLIGTALTAQVSISSNNILVIGYSISRVWPLILLLIPYIFIIIMIFNAYHIRRYANIGNPVILVNNYLDAPEQETKKNVVEDIAKAYEENHKEIENKACYVEYAFKALIMESILLAIALIITIFR
jgi:hypothetical protein